MHNSTIPRSVPTLFLLILLSFCFLPDRGSAQDRFTLGSAMPDTTLSGQWGGSITSISRQWWRLILHVTAYPDGPCEAYFDRPDRSLFGIRFRNTSCMPDKLLFFDEQTNVRFEGSYDSFDNSINGTWTENGNKQPLRLRKIVTVQKFQEPTTDVPYITSDVKVINRRAGVRLEGTLCQPSLSGRFPVVLFISDGGPQDRNSEIGGHKPFLVIADAFARRGFAALRVDDRGMGHSTGKPSTMTVEDVADDAVAAIDFLRANPNVDTNRIFLYAHGEGGLAAVLASRMRPQVRGICAAATPAVAGTELLTSQIEAMETRRGTSTNVVDTYTDLISKWIHILENTIDDDEAVKAMGQVADAVARNTPSLKGMPEFSELYGPARNDYLRIVIMPWLLSYMKMDAPGILRSVAVPMLALYAEKDVTVPADINSAAMSKVLDAAGVQGTVLTIDGVNHQFQSCTECSPEESERLAETIRPAVLGIVLDWADGIR